MEGKYRKEKQEDAKANVDYSVQQNAAAAQAKTQGEAQVIQLKESIKGEVLVAVESMKGQIAQQLAVLNEILKQNSSREQKILDETPLAVLAEAAQQMAPTQQGPSEELMESPEEGTRPQMVT